jgi:hypothetical protein
MGQEMDMDSAIENKQDLDLWFKKKNFFSTTQALNNTWKNLHLLCVFLPPWVYASICSQKFFSAFE